MGTGSSNCDECLQGCWPVKILILTPTLPYPAHQGGALRNQGIIRGLAAEGHEITLLSFSDGTASDWKALYAWCRRVEVLPTPPRPLHDRLRDLIFTGQPDLAQRLISSGYRARLIELLGAERFDIVHIEGLELGVYLRTIREYQPETKIIYDAHNAEYMLQRGIAAVERTNLLKLPGAVYSQVQAKRIRTFEQEVCEQADAVIAVSEDDARSLR
ncbi:MAG: glycosyltransferase, partial [Anaerolinea sp.]|nr:glycosyltransferase [Anaerolinea sp.]